MRVIYKKFNELLPEDLYQILQLRFEIFVIEQDCIYRDIDDVDRNALHVYIKDENQIVAYSRIIPPEKNENHSSIGRVIVRSTHRSLGLGREIVDVCIKKCVSLYPQVQIRIHAQTYLEKFYNSLGFEKTGKYFLEDQLPHLEMIYTKHQN